MSTHGANCGVYQIGGECTCMARKAPVRSLFPLSPLLPVKPDWEAMAIELANAYIQYDVVCAQVKLQQADGGQFWDAKNRVDRASGTILSWKDEPELYGRMLAREQILREWERRVRSMCYPCLEGHHDDCKHALCSCNYVCPNVSNNTPHQGCCEQCRYELGL